MQAHELLQLIDRKIAERSILDHPFYRAWQAGTLTREQLAGYAAEYFPHVAAFPGYLEKALTRTTDVAVRAEIADNLREELSVPAPHPGLWLDFAHGLGGDADTIRVATATAATRHTVDEFEALCEATPGEALAALYCYESQQPRVAAEKAKGLVERYGVSDETALAYFTVHAEADVRHSAGERQAIARCLETGTSTAEQILAAADRALDAYWHLLDGICHSTGVECPTSTDVADAAAAIN
jgi:pyrroloquinoline-quinone synthase